MQLPPDPSRPLGQWDPPDRWDLERWKQHLSGPWDLARWKQRRSDPLDQLDQE